MSERRPWKNRIDRRLPKRFRDLLPEPPVPVAPAPGIPPTASQQHPPSLSSEAANPDAQPSSSVLQVVRNHINQLFTTQRNRFGLFRRYTTASPPSHDPEGNLTFDEFNDSSEPSHVDSPPETFYPYPNRNAFLLGDWYWNGGVQKSQESFKSLIDIVGDSTFSPADVGNAKWDSINRTLANDDCWLDQDAAWERTTVSITVPFQRRRNAANSTGSPQEYLVSDFYHRSLVSVMKEALSNPTNDDLFHYEPFALHFQPDLASDPVRVHGELYTSPAFIDAHASLQEMPPEEGCSLPRCIMALMFSSDATHLTSFGDAQLWPLYLFFGNESKYRRCKPSCRLGHHIAYFQRVSQSFVSYPPSFDSPIATCLIQGVCC